MCVLTRARINAKISCIVKNNEISIKTNFGAKENKQNCEEVKLKMAGMKSWLEKFKNLMLKKDFDYELVKSKIQSDEEIAIEIANECVKENELPDLNTPTSYDIELATRNKQKEIEIQNSRKEAMKVKEMHKIEKIKENKILQRLDMKSKNKGFIHFTDVPKRTRRT